MPTTYTVQKFKPGHEKSESNYISRTGEVTPLKAGSFEGYSVSVKPPMQNAEDIASRNEFITVHEDSRERTVLLVAKRFAAAVPGFIGFRWYGLPICRHDRVTC